MSGGQRGRPPGLPKTGGRAKGTPNRATLALCEKLATLGCDPVEELVKLARLPGSPINSKIAIYTTLLPYVYPRRKPMDDSEFVDSASIVMTAEEVVQYARAIVKHYSTEAELKNQDATQNEKESSDGDQVSS